MFYGFSDRPKTGVVFETCQGNEEPIIFTGHSRNLWVDFVADHNTSGRGFQISFLTIDGKLIYLLVNTFIALFDFCVKNYDESILFFLDELGYLVDAIVSDEMIDSFDKRPNDMSIEVIFKQHIINQSISIMLNKRKIVHCVKIFILCRISIYCRVYFCY